MIASNCDLGATGVFFLWAHLPDNGGVCDLLTLVVWDVTEQDDIECVSTHYLLALDICSNSHYLAKSPYLIEA